jgi:hypothetical protein
VPRDSGSGQPGIGKPGCVRGQVRSTRHANVVFSCWVFAAVLVGVFSFGARQALASPAYTVCDPPAYNGGSCADTAECEANCEALYPGVWVWAKCYTSGCCNCFF